MITTPLEGAFAEKTTMRINAVIQDEKGNALISTDISTITLTLCKKPTGEIINSRNDSDIKNSNGGVFDDVAKTFSLTLGPNDMVIVDPNEDIEIHVALIEWTFSGGKAGKHEIEFVVKNLAKV